MEKKKKKKWLIFDSYPRSSEECDTANPWLYSPDFKEREAKALELKLKEKKKNKIKIIQPFVGRGGSALWVSIMCRIIKVLDILKLKLLGGWSSGLPL